MLVDIYLSSRANDVVLLLLFVCLLGAGLGGHMSTDNLKLVHDYALLHYARLFIYNYGGLPRAMKC